VVDLRVAFPAIGTSTDDVRRMHPPQQSPYAVIYRQIGDHIRIMVVRGLFRDPGSGESPR
jgi:adenosylcobinamide amidohydrolase